MKKSLLSLVIITSLFFVFGFSHSSSAEKATGKEYEEKSIEESYRDAVKGISDIDTSKFDISSEVSTISANSTNSLSANPLDVEKYSTAQILSETVNTQGDKEQLIAVTVFNDIGVEDESGESEIGIFGDKGNSTGDLFARAYSRIYYISSSSRGVSYAKLTRVTGGWEVMNPLTTLGNKTVRYGSSGWPNGTQAGTKYPSLNSYSYTMPSSWGKTALTGSYAIGTTSTVTVYRSGASYTIKLNNNL
ncbi:hypothetical protein RVS70_11695 [Virgibacillus sp. M23]|uniref:hypothetical protein n=1 Tax=Virgibacillus sp. M23 TaxID=3079030 RepID=UPI002A91582A|nr:hypothetical protein [Virgibacillus sp. M23]MDY7044866.1 hypothetical protein [Virgibacillus sp. M23]